MENVYINLVHIFQNIASVTISKTTGTVISASILGTDIPMDQNFYYYNSSNGNNSEFIYRASGAYIFRPQVNSTVTLINAKPKVETFTGMNMYIDYINDDVGVFQLDMNISAYLLVNRIF